MKVDYSVIYPNIFVFVSLSIFWFFNLFTSSVDFLTVSVCLLIEKRLIQIVDTWQDYITVTWRCQLPVTTTHTNIKQFRYKTVYCIFKHLHQTCDSCVYTMKLQCLNTINYTLACSLDMFLSHSTIFLCDL